MWFGTVTWRSLLAKVDEVLKGLVSVKTYAYMAFKEAQQLTQQVKALSDHVSELSLKLDALHVQYARPVPGPAAALPPSLDFRVPNIFEELPLNHDQGFRLDDLKLDDGYKEHAL